MKTVYIKDTCMACGGTGYSVAKADFGMDSKCRGCNGYGYLLEKTEAPDDVLIRGEYVWSSYDDWFGSPNFIETHKGSGSD